MSRRFVFAFIVAAGCGGYGSAMPPDGSVQGTPGRAGMNGSATGAAGTGAATDGGAGTGAAGTASLPTLPPPTATPDFQLRAEVAGPCAKAAGPIDVNVGNRPEDFVRAAHCQITGAEPSADAVAQWSAKLRTDEHVRRIDVVRTLCKDAGRSCVFTYSNPWTSDIPLTPTCMRKGTRELGAVFMYWSDCPRGVNCGMDWANTHAHGMSAAHPLFAFDAAAANYYNPRNAGYWHRQLLDAAWAGLQFFAINTYGPDLLGNPDQLALLNQALAKAGPAVKIALFDDPWAWGQPGSPTPFRVRPNLADTEAAAQLIYQQKWKPFYTRLEKPYWYTFQNRPFIYFYNAGTLTPLNASAAVVARLKQLFAQDFGVTPFVAVETAYFQDGAMPGVADAQFRWNTIASGQKSRSVMNGVTMDHFMAKWDSLGRDKPGAIASSADRMIKGPALLKERLAESQDAQIAVIATWNDLGEGTGIERNYDYYVAGAWSPPTTFMSVTRAAQCAD
jgi:hypothetical protein